MRVRVVVLTELLACAALVAGAPGALAKGTTAPPPAMATGGVNYINVGGTPVHLSFTAQAPGRGQVEYVGGNGVQFHGVVDCYVQTADGARFSGYITTTNNPRFTAFRGSVIDNGEPGTSDLVRFGFRPSTSHHDCTEPYAALRTVGSGNVQVHTDPSAAMALDSVASQETPDPDESE